MLTTNLILDSCNENKPNFKIKYNLCDKSISKIYSSKEAVNFLKEKFFLIPEVNNIGLMTGYYEPELRAYKSKGNSRYPIYKNPNIIGNKKLTELSRQQINRGALNGYNLEIAWVENEIEAFFLHIQGSGRLKFSNTEVIKIKYAGNNNKKYKSIGKILIKKGYLKKQEVNMFSIKKWLYDNPNLARKIMEKNKRFIFFEVYKGEIEGSSQLPLVPKVSVAVDDSYIKSGTPIIIQNIENKKDIFLGLAHDKGNAIKGKYRIDLFTGFGKNAEFIASGLKKKIRVWPLELNK